MTKLPSPSYLRGEGGVVGMKNRCSKYFLEFFYCKHKQPVIVISMSTVLIPHFRVWNIDVDARTWQSIKVIYIICVE